MPLEGVQGDGRASDVPEVGLRIPRAGAGSDALARGNLPPPLAAAAAATAAAARRRTPPEPRDGGGRGDGVELGDGRPRWTPRWTPRWKGVRRRGGEHTALEVLSFGWRAARKAAATAAKPAAATAAAKPAAATAATAAAATTAASDADSHRRRRPCDTTTAAAAAAAAAASSQHMRLEIPSSDGPVAPSRGQHPSLLGVPFEAIDGALVGLELEQMRPARAQVEELHHPVLERRGEAGRRVLAELDVAHLGGGDKGELLRGEALIDIPEAHTALVRGDQQQLRLIGREAQPVHGAGGGAAQLANERIAAPLRVHQKHVTRGRAGRDMRRSGERPPLHIVEIQIAPSHRTDDIVRLVERVGR